MDRREFSTVGELLEALRPTYRLAPWRVSAA